MERRAGIAQHTRMTQISLVALLGSMISCVGCTHTSESMSLVEKFPPCAMTVIPGRQTRGGITFGSVDTLTLEDANAIQKEAPSVLNVSPEQVKFLQVWRGDKQADVQVVGCGATFAHIRHYEVTQGAFFTEQDFRSEQRVCVLGWQVYKDLFGDENPVGQKVSLKGQDFQVIGVFKERGGGGFQSEDDRVYVPVTWVLKHLFQGSHSVATMSIEGRNENVMKKAQDEVTEILIRRHKIVAKMPNDFIIFNNADAAKNRID